jgi:hypothetical protein
MSVSLKAAMEAARSHLVKENILTEERARNKSAQGLCNMLRLRYADGSAPYGKSEKQNALISWFATRRKIVIKSQIDEMRSIKRNEKIEKRKSQKIKSLSLSDRALLDSAAYLAGKLQKRLNKFAHNHANSDKFLSSYEWRRLRLEAIKLHGSRCQCCGASPVTGAVLNVDHIKPRRLFPKLALDINNLQVLCQDCNHGKPNWDFTDWRENNAGHIDLIESDSKNHIQSILDD